MQFRRSVKKCELNSHSKPGFTLVELLIVIVVIGILSAMMMIAASEFIASAKANNIIANLTTLKKATLAWYMDNLDKVAADGRVMIGGSPKPVQEWSDQYLNLSGYINNMGSTGINLNNKQTVTYSDGSKKTNTTMAPGYYGVCDGGNGKRKNWYVGYCFNSGEERVREKVVGRKASLGLWLGTADAHENKNEDNSAAVWLHVLSM